MNAAEMQPCGTPEGWTALAERFVPLVKQYQEAGALHARANFRYEVNREMLSEVFNAAQPGMGDNLPQGTVANGEYESWHSGTRWRVRCQMDPKLCPQWNYDIAFDGETYQMLLKSSRLLLLSRGDESSPLILKDPLLAPLEFIKPVRGGDTPMALKYKEVSERNLRAQAQQWTQIAARSPDVTAFLVKSAGNIGDAPFDYRVTFSSKEARLPARLERLYADETVFLATDIEYQEVATAAGVQKWPHVVYTRHLLGEGRIDMGYRWEIVQLDVGGPLPDDVFTIDHRLADVIRDRDAGAAKQTAK